MTFFNPYIKKKYNPDVPAACQYIQILPKGIIHDGEKGLLKNLCEKEPRMFYREKQYLLDKDMKWPSLKRKCSDSLSSSGVLKFHVYDAIESVLCTEDIEYLPYNYRHHVIPTGTVIRLFGKTVNGVKICVNVFGQLSYIYCEVPSETYLHDVMKKYMYENNKNFTFSTAVDNKFSMYGFNRSPVTVYKITFTDYFAAREVGRMLEAQKIKVYETSVDVLSRFYIDNDYPSFGWYTVQKYSINEYKFSNQSLEISCSVKDLCPLDEDIWPEYDCLTFDIECMSESGGFPNASVQSDIVIQISAVLHKTGSDNMDVHLFTLGTCDPIDDAHIYEFPCEYELIYAFLIFVKQVSPEIITGYNIINFDLNYLIIRATKLYRLGVGEFTKLKKGLLCIKSTNDFKQGFNCIKTKVYASGMICIDFYPVCVGKITSDNYKLDTIANLCLGKHKEDMPYKRIPIEFISGSGGRCKVGRYCIQDSVIVKELFCKFNYHMEASAISKLAYLPIRKVINDGQQRRVFTCILHETRKRNMLIPDKIAPRETGEDESYRGATVLDPHVGYYASPVIVMDFASLYPSIMIANNLCYSTLILNDEDVTGIDEKDILTVHVNKNTVYRFVRSGVRESMLGTLLSRWLRKRKEVKARMKRCEDPMLALILDKQQLALKVTCNAFYGFTGAVHGLLPCLPLAASITSIGRDMLRQTSDFINNVLSSREYVSEKFGLSDGDFQGDFSLNVIYGDTDSVFVCVKNIVPERLAGICADISAHVSSQLFIEPIKLEFEKMFLPLMLICKKRYVGKMFDSDELVMKGVELVRKTSCPFVKNIVKEIVRLLFWDSEVARAAVELSQMSCDEVIRNGLPAGIHKIIDIIIGARDRLYTNKVDVNELVLSTMLSKEISMYKQPNLPHLRVIERLRNRNEEVPVVGDRVSYVLISSMDKNVANYELSEDPLYVIENNIPINAERYFEQLVKAVSNIICPIIPKDTIKKERFLLGVIPARVYLHSSFRDSVIVM
uniref:DNA polymerase n=1 Tax=Suid betaherpesvirus 2 TaxID=1608255 RepID=Q9IFI5_9BETA|nr:DNA polymerase [Suid betaherpesvirus 2]